MRPDTGMTTLDGVRLGAALRAGVHGGPGMLVVGVQDYLPPPAGFTAAQQQVRS